MNSMALMVCPHDTAGNPLKWFQFAYHITKYGHHSTRYYPCLDFTEFHEKMSESDIIYASPQDSLTMLENHHYVPVARPVNLYDEIVFIANHDVANDSLAVLNGSECLSCNSMLVTRVGIKGLLAKGITPKRIYSETNWMAVLKAVSQGKKPYGFVYKDFYDGLSDLSKSMVTKLGETQERSIFHCVLMKNDHQDKSDSIAQILLEMHNDAKGSDVIKDIDIERFITVSGDEILEFNSLFALGSDIMEE